MSSLVHKHPYLTNALIKDLPFEISPTTFAVIYEKQHNYFSKTLFAVFLQTGALWADSLAEIQRISTSTLARSSEILQRARTKTEDGDLEAIRGWQLQPGVADSEKEREEEREKEGMPHDCHNDFNICACEGH